MSFDKGSLILIDYTARLKDTDKVFDTTIEEDAKKHSIYESNVTYQPKLVSIGEYNYSVLQGLDEALAKTSVGDKLTVEVTPDKAFGERDSKKVRILPIRKLGDDADKVTVGDTIEIDSRKGTIRHIGSGRVHVDFNHAFAGQTIIYDLTVIKSIDSSNDKINEIVLRKFARDDAEIKFNSEDTTVDVIIPNEISRAETLQMAKYFVVQDVFKFVPTLHKLNFIETHVNPQTQNDNPETTAEQPATTTETTAEQPATTTETTAEQPATTTQERSS